MTGTGISLYQFGAQGVLDVLDAWGDGEPLTAREIAYRMVASVLEVPVDDPTVDTVVRVRYVIDTTRRLLADLGQVGKVRRLPGRPARYVRISERVYEAPREPVFSEVQVRLTTSNAAFDDDAGAEVARILRTLADAAERGGFAHGGPYASFALHDVNGNPVGAATWREQR